jgi:hypothetical protein
MPEIDAAENVISLLINCGGICGSPLNWNMDCIKGLQSPTKQMPTDVEPTTSEVSPAELGVCLTTLQLILGRFVRADQANKDTFSALTNSRN